MNFQFIILFFVFLAYMAKLIIPEDILVKNVNTLPKYKDAELADAVVSNSDIGMGPGLPAQAENIRGTISWHLKLCSISTPMFH